MSIKNAFCQHCVNPVNMGLLKPGTNQELQFVKTGSKFICESCLELQDKSIMPTRNFFDQEFEHFLAKQDSILFAYSGGLDSTVVLAKLWEECKRRHIDLRLFTVDTKVKGRQAMQNIKACLDHLGLKRRHLFVDIAEQVQTAPQILQVTGQAMTTTAVYQHCLNNGLLPCGKICNAMIDQAYDRIMKGLDYQLMVTGGDTPKKNRLGVYSIFWQKPSGVTIVRGGYAFGQTKDSNALFIREQGLPWVHPHCGGYDTDCLVPGVYFFDQLHGQAEQDARLTIRQFPIILEYVSERVRFGVITRDQGLRMLSQVDIASSESHHELMQIFKDTPA